MITAGLWYGFSEHLESYLKDHPKERGSRSVTLSSSLVTLSLGDDRLFTSYWYMVTAAVAALFGAALNVLKIHKDSQDEDQQRLIPEELR